MGYLLYYGSRMVQEQAGEKFFHGPLYSEGPWNSKTHVCCRLCKTKNSRKKLKHWAKGLCRSCYRRLSVTHRLYNDKWNADRSKNKDKPKKITKKDYKSLEPANIHFDDQDIETLLDRYAWRCAYSGEPLQAWAHKKRNAFQLEYVIDSNGKVMLIPVCRSINCSKKSINTEKELQNWAAKHRITYPFIFITAEQFLED